MEVTAAFAQITSNTVCPVRPVRGSDEFCSVFVHIRLANQMLMLVSGGVARQGSRRMVISVELPYNKEADYQGALFFFFLFPARKPTFMHSPAQLLLKCRST